MKKLVLVIAVVAVVFSSCRKEDNLLVNDCNCGIVQSDNVQGYTVKIKNECSGAWKTFTLSAADWMNAHVGTRHCITNVANW